MSAREKSAQQVTAAAGGAPAPPTTGPGGLRDAIPFLRDALARVHADGADEAIESAAALFAGTAAAGAATANAFGEWLGQLVRQGLAPADAPVPTWRDAKGKLRGISHLRKQYQRAADAEKRTWQIYTSNSGTVTVYGSRVLDGEGVAWNLLSAWGEAHLHYAVLLHQQSRVAGIRARIAAVEGHMRTAGAAQLLREDLANVLAAQRDDLAEAMRARAVASRDFARACQWVDANGGSRRQPSRDAAVLLDTTRRITVASRDGLATVVGESRGLVPAIPETVDEGINSERERLALP